MSKSPFVKINVGNDPNKDLTNRVESFRFSESIDKDNLVEVVLKENYSLELGNSGWLATGNIISFQFGFMGVHVSRVRKAKIIDFDTDYGNRIIITFRATDFGAAMKKDTSSKIWSKIKASDIAIEIAKLYGLSYKVDATSKVYGSIPQGNKSFHAFLKYLAAEETGSNYQFYVLDSTLYFVKINLLKQSKITYTYGENIVSFRPKIREFQAEKGTNEATVIGVDDKSKKVNAQQSNGNSIKGQEALGEELVRVYNSNGDFTKTEKRQSTTKKTDTEWSVNGVVKSLGNITGALIPSPSGDPTDVKNKAEGENKKATMKVMEASLTVTGNPDIEAGDIITIKGTLQIHAGNYYVTDVDHVIRGNGSYQSSLQLSKNAIKQPETKNKGDLKVNNSVGGDKADNRKEVEKVRVYNGKAVHLGNAATKEEELKLRNSSN